MLKAFTHLQVRLATRDRGATAVEYGLMIAGIAVVIIAVVIGIGSKLNIAFTNINNKL